MTVNELIDEFNKLKDKMRAHSDVGEWKVRINPEKSNSFSSHDICTYVPTELCPPWRYQLSKTQRCPDEVFLVNVEVSEDVA